MGVSKAPFVHRGRLVHPRARAHWKSTQRKPVSRQCHCNHLQDAHRQLHHRPGRRDRRLGLHRLPLRQEVSSSSAFPCSCSVLRTHPPPLLQPGRARLLRAGVCPRCHAHGQDRAPARPERQWRRLRRGRLRRHDRARKCSSLCRLPRAGDSDEKLLRRERMTSRSRAAARCCTWPPTSPPTPPTER